MCAEKKVHYQQDCERMAVMEVTYFVSISQ